MLGLRMGAWPFAGGLAGATAAQVMAALEALQESTAPKATKPAKVNQPKLPRAELLAIAREHEPGVKE